MANPIPIDYMEPNPVYAPPELGEEDLFKITNAAISTLKAEA